MSEKRKGFSLGDHNKRVKTEEASLPSPPDQNVPKNPFLKHPVVPDKAIAIFLTQVRNSARSYLPKDTKLPITHPFCEVEARLGILKSNVGLRDARVASSGPKTVNNNQMAHAFMIHNGIMESGISRSNYIHWTLGGLSQMSPMALAFGVTNESHMKRDLVEKEYTETVYAGYPNNRRVVFAGLHPPSSTPTVGKMEHKEKLTTMDLCLPAANYDLRISLTTEKSLDSHVSSSGPPPGWTMKRVKRRRSYTRRDHSIAWQLDVTEVTTTYCSANKPATISYEVEMELQDSTTLQLINLEDSRKVENMIKQLAQQLWWMLKQMNPLNDVLNVEDFLQPHPDSQAVLLAQATCGALKKYMQQQQQQSSRQAAVYKCPIGGTSDETPSNLANVKFMGCMPVNFSRHDIELVQRSAENGYFTSEKTDGVRHLLIFTGTTAVLVDRTMAGKQPIPRPNSSEREADPFAPILPLIQPGTVLDGEVVMHRKLRRPIFIVFDVLALSTTQPILQLPFEQRLHHLKRASFRTPTANRDMFDEKDVLDPTVALPLVRKNFVKRRELDELLSHVVEERGMRTYRNGTVHNHLTDGIIFQPNLPYVCGTDVNLLKWKYLDTVTIDVELLPPNHYGHRNNDDDNEDKLCVGVLGEEGTLVDMTRFVKLPQSELRRLEADRQETGSKIAEVGFDPTTGEWYYLTMRPDKTDPNHISTVLGTLLELAESLTTEELRYRMSVPVGARDTYRKDVGRMQKQLLEHQRKENKAAAAAAGRASK
jgi:hypothetical protein